MNAFPLLFLLAIISLNGNAVVLPYDYRNPSATVHMHRRVHVLSPSPAANIGSVTNFEPPHIVTPSSISPSASSSFAPVNPTPLPSPSPMVIPESELAFPSPAQMTLSSEQDTAPVEPPAPTRTPKPIVVQTPDLSPTPSVSPKPTKTANPMGRQDGPFSSTTPLPSLPTASHLPPSDKPPPIPTALAKPTRKPPTAKARPTAPFSSASPLPLLPSSSPIHLSSSSMDNDAVVSPSDEELKAMDAGDHPTLSLVAAETGRTGTTLHDGFNICPHNLAFRGISIACEYPGARSATFLVDDKVVRTARLRPFTISGLDDGLVAPWEDYPDGSTVRITCIVDDEYKYSATGRFTCD